MINCSGQDTHTHTQSCTVRPQGIEKTEKKAQTKFANKKSQTMMIFCNNNKKNTNRSKLQRSCKKTLDNIFLLLLLCVKKFSFQQQKRININAIR